MRRNATKPVQRETGYSGQSLLEPRPTYKSASPHIAAADNDVTPLPVQFQHFVYPRQIVRQVRHYDQNRPILNLVEARQDCSDNSPANIVLYKEESRLTTAYDPLHDRHRIVLIEVVDNNHPDIRSDLRANRLPQRLEVRPFVVNGDDDRQSICNYASRVQLERFALITAPPRLAPLQGRPGSPARSTIYVLGAPDSVSDASGIDLLFYPRSDLVKHFAKIGRRSES